MECTAEPSIRAFFETFEKSSAAGDAETLAGFYAASFLAAGPNGAQVVKASDMIHVIPKRKQLLEGIGCRSAKLMSLHETKLDARYSLVRTEWRWQWDQGGKPSDATVSSTFMVQRSGEGLQIVLYLPHGDIMAILRERGMIPAAQG